MLSNGRHSGFPVYCDERIFPRGETAMKNLARYIIRASFSQERMQYFPGPAKVVYRAKEGSEERGFDTQEWLAAMCSHIPDRGEQMVWYQRSASIRTNSSNGNHYSNFNPTVVYLVEEVNLRGRAKLSSKGKGFFLKSSVGRIP